MSTKKRTIQIDVERVRSHPNQPESFHINLPGTIDIKWSGDDQAMCFDIWHYIWKEHGAKLVSALRPEELQEFRDLLAQAGDHLAANPSKERAHLTALIEETA